MSRLTAASPVQAKIIEQYPDGSGVVEVPITVETDRIDFSRTEGGGEKRGKISEEELMEMASNFPEWPGPVGVGFSGKGPREGHKRFDDRGQEQEAFMQDVHFRGDTLWARIWATGGVSDADGNEVVPNRFAQLVAGLWRGFSIEWATNPKMPTRKFNGATLIGGLFTNRPATDVHFRFAESVSMLEFRIRPDGPEERNMSKTLEVQLAEQVDKVKELSGKLEVTTQEVVSLKAKVEEGERALSAKVEELSKAHKEIGRLGGIINENRRATDRVKIVQVIDSALSTGRADPAEFEKEVNGQSLSYKTDPLGWLEQSAYPDVTTLENVLAARPEGSKPKKVSSGRPDDGDPQAAQAELRKIASERKVTFNQALDILREEQPEVYKQVAALYRTA